MSNKDERRTLHPEVEKIVLGTHDPPEEAEWKICGRIFKRAVYPPLPYLCANVRRGLRIDWNEHAKLVARHCKMSREEPFVKDVIEGVKAIHRKEFVRLENAFTVAFICEDSVFFDDMAFINNVLKERPETIEGSEEFYSYDQAINSLRAEGKDITAKDIAKLLDELDDYRPGLDTVRNRLKRDFKII